jgi:hypothetical protein
VLSSFAASAGTLRSLCLSLERETYCRPSLPVSLAFVISIRSVPRPLSRTIWPSRSSSSVLVMTLASELNTVKQSGSCDLFPLASSKQSSISELESRLGVKLKPGRSSSEFRSAELNDLLRRGDERGSLGDVEGTREGDWILSDPALERVSLMFWLITILMSEMKEFPFVVIRGPWPGS